MWCSVLIYSRQTEKYNERTTTKIERIKRRRNQFLRASIVRSSRSLKIYINDVNKNEKNIEKIKETKRPRQKVKFFFLLFILNSSSSSSYSFWLLKLWFVLHIEVCCPVGLYKRKNFSFFCFFFSLLSTHRLSEMSEWENIVILKLHSIRCTAQRYIFSRFFSILRILRYFLFENQIFQTK